MIVNDSRWLANNTLVCRTICFDQYLVHVSIWIGEQPLRSICCPPRLPRHEYLLYWLQWIIGHYHTSIFIVSFVI
ncbi:unnamed protein product [Rotaria sordida]|uniref:Uncharacterized protein n=1 Tax=Rotaria sordida TaxID=392033 RepID=A0A815H5N0_9BILA|nr:unnamed protein product [Rotaria sordida]